MANIYEYTSMNILLCRSTHVKEEVDFVELFICHIRLKYYPRSTYMYGVVIVVVLNVIIIPNISALVCKIVLHSKYLKKINNEIFCNKFECIYH